LLLLINNATVWQGSGTYSSDFIEYDIKTSLVKAGDRDDDNANNSKQRVHVVIQPKP
jgi:lipopolysaccharide export system protein LptA